MIAKNQQKLKGCTSLSDFAQLDTVLTNQNEVNAYIVLVDSIFQHCNEDYFHNIDQVIIFQLGKAKNGEVVKVASENDGLVNCVVKSGTRTKGVLQNKMCLNVGLMDTP